jgi:hypothetical protein
MVGLSFRYRCRLSCHHIQSILRCLWKYIDFQQHTRIRASVKCSPPTTTSIDTSGPQSYFLFQKVSLRRQHLAASLLLPAFPASCWELLGLRRRCSGMSLLGTVILFLTQVVARWITFFERESLRVDNKKPQGREKE